MSNNSRISLIEKQQVYACADGSCTATAQTESPASSTRDLFTRQTGQALIALGKVFVNVPPFSDHIDPNTGKMLISIGKKLKKK